MRRCLATRAAIVLLALLLPATAVRAAAVSCCVDDCALPCCDRDAAHSTLLPVLPCCRAVTADRLSAQPAPATAEHDAAAFAVPPVGVTPVPIVALHTSLAAASLRMLAPPPLYQRHCALLL